MAERPSSRTEPAFAAAAAEACIEFVGPAFDIVAIGGPAKPFGPKLALESVIIFYLVFSPPKLRPSCSI